MSQFFNIIWLFLLLISINTQYTTTPPSWQASNQFQADYLQIITSTTPSGGVPPVNYTFNFNTSFSAKPNLAYGLKQYKGRDRLVTEALIMRTAQLTLSRFVLSVQILNGTVMIKCEVAYIAISHTFPHHLNSFDDVPINYSSPLINITGNELTIRSFTQVINYTSQSLAAGFTHNIFQTPLDGNKIILLLSAFSHDSWAVNGTTYSQSLEIQAHILNISHYSVTAIIHPSNQVFRLRFSEIIFNQDDIRSSNKYQLKYIQILTQGSTGSSIVVPGLYAKNFIIGLKHFNASSANCGIYYRWSFDIPNSQVSFSPSAVESPGTQVCALQYMTSVGLYIKTWLCPATHPYFNLTTLVCQDYCTTFHYYPDNTDTSNVSCQRCTYSCLTCSLTNSTIICITCDLVTNHRILINNSCLCDGNYFQNYTQNQQCLYCPTSIVNCINCTAISNTITHCTLCNISYYLSSNTSCSLCTFVLPECINCSSNGLICYECNSNNNTVFLNTTSMFCETCMISNCVTCFNLTHCIVCDVANNYNVNSVGKCSQCEALCNCDGYYQPVVNGKCSTVCGDGLVRVNQGCDDGNANDNDGCSSVCQVQPNWVCHTPGRCCQFASAILLQLQSLSKVRTENSIQVRIKVSPSVSMLSTQTQSVFPANSVTTNDTAVVYSSATYVDQLNQLVLQFRYYENVHKRNIIITINPNLPPSSATCTPIPISIPFSISLTPSDSLPIVYYSDKQYQTYQSSVLLFKWVEILSYIVMIVSMLTCKIVGVELMGVLQLAFFTLSNHNYLNNILLPLTGLKSINGLNIKVSNNPNTLPQRLKHLQQEVLFIDNCNVMMAVMVAEMLVGIALYFLTKSNKTEHQRRAHWVSKHMLKQFLITLILFNSFNLAFSATIQYNYAQGTEQYYTLSMLMAVFANILPIIMIIGLLCTQKAEFGEFKNKMKTDCLSTWYFLFTLLYRMALGCFMGSIREQSLETLLILPICIAFLIYFCTNLPFKDAYQNYRACICHLTMFASLFVTMYYRSMKGQTDVSVAARQYFPAYIQIIGIVLSLAVSSVVLGYQVLLLIRNSIKTREKVIPENNNTKQSMPNNIQFTIQGFNQQ